MGHTRHHTFGRPYSRGLDADKPKPLAELSVAASAFSDILVHTHNTLSLRRDLKYTYAADQRSGIVFISFCYDLIR